MGVFVCKECLGKHSIDLLEVLWNFQSRIAKSKLRTSCINGLKWWAASLRNKKSIIIILVQGRLRFGSTIHKTLITRRAHYLLYALSIGTDWLKGRRMRQTHRALACGPQSLRLLTVGLAKGMLNRWGYLNACLMGINWHKTHLLAQLSMLGPQDILSFDWGAQSACSIQLALHLASVLLIELQS